MSSLHLIDFLDYLKEQRFLVRILYYNYVQKKPTDSEKPSESDYDYELSFPI